MAPEQVNLFISAACSNPCKQTAFMHQLVCCKCFSPLPILGGVTSVWNFLRLERFVILCCRSANAESEARIFRSADSSASCTDRKPKNILPKVLKHQTNDPLQSLRQVNSRISLSTKKLPPFKGTIFKADFVEESTLIPDPPSENWPLLSSG